MTEAASDLPRQLFAPIEHILTCGGDTRLSLDSVSQLNGYGCRPFPRPEAFTFASSTATSISERAYAAAAAARQDLMRDSAGAGFDAAFDAHQERLRGALKQLLGLDGSECGIVFSPSGTDSQLHALFVARAILGTPLVSVVAAADETGSGTAFAARGRHFNAVTASGAAVVKDGPIAGMSEGVDSLPVPMRDASGALRPYDALDAAIMQGVAQTLAAGKRALLFAMDSSKLGLRSPSLDCLRWMAEAAGEEVQVVIDAAQMRLGRKRIRWYLDQGFMVLVTGSKFFTGAPFSGALLLPPRIVAHCRRIDQVPEGLLDYTSRCDWPASLPSLRAALPARTNLGQWLRWVSALEEMRAFFAAPKSFRELALTQFSEVVPRLIAAENCFEPMQFDDMVLDESGDEEMAPRTIFPFFVRRNGRLLSQAETVKLYHALNDDVTPLLPANLPPMQRLLAARRCHIGQPVAVADGRGGIVGALRISAGARVVSESWRGEMRAARDNLRCEFDQVRAILAKLRLLLRHFDDVAPAYEQPRAVTPYRVSAA